MFKILSVSLFLLFFQVQAWAQQHPVIMQIAPGANIRMIASALNGKVVESDSTTNIHLLRLPVVPSLESVSRLGVVWIERDQVVSQKRDKSSGSEGTGGGQSKRDADQDSQQLVTMAILTHSGAVDWYAAQPSMKLVQADKALQYSRGRGVVVADLNSRVDYAHPALRGHLTMGKDFVQGRSSTAAVLDQSDASFLDQSDASFLDQSDASFLDDQSEASFLDQSEASFLDQSEASFLDQSEASFLDSQNPAHGHATMCAGIIAAIAPDSMIMPLRVFDDKGSADFYTIAGAIRYAADSGAHVINMSFGINQDSRAVRSAVAYATGRGVVVVASAGNDNSSEPQYPAAYDNVISVTSTTLMDLKVGFSNYGRTIDVSAPGVNIISAYPGGYYALASGTSFSAPMVAAEAALLRAMSWRGTEDAISAGTVSIDLLNPLYIRQLGRGRIDMLKAVQRQSQN